MSASEHAIDPKAIDVDEKSWETEVIRRSAELLVVVYFGSSVARAC